MKNAVVYYSNTGESKRIAEYFAAALDYGICDIYETQDKDFDNLVFVFPVHCQNLPSRADAFLSDTRVKNLTLIATYGRMCHGNVLWEAQKKYPHNVIAAAYVPTKHTYLDESGFNRFNELNDLIKKIRNPLPVTIPKSYKNLFAGFMKTNRTRMGVRIFKTDKCTSCGICTAACKNNAIVNGETGKNCIRCLKCVSECPSGALQFDLHPLMKMYLKKKKKDDLVIYI